MIEMLACAVTGRSSVYVTTPSISGCRFIDWYPRRGPGLTLNHPDYREGHRRHDVEANLAHAASAVQRVRGAFPDVTILDPTVVEQVGWRQADCHEIWATVIKRYTDTVVFLEGWEYSEGCAYEFLTALRTGARPLHEV